MYVSIPLESSWYTVVSFGLDFVTLSRQWILQTLAFCQIFQGEEGSCRKSDSFCLLLYKKDNGRKEKNPTYSLMTLFTGSVSLGQGQGSITETPLCHSLRDFGKSFNFSELFFMHSQNRQKLHFFFSQRVFSKGKARKVFSFRKSFLTLPDWVKFSLKLPLWLKNNTLYQTCWRISTYLLHLPVIQSMVGS